MIARETVARSPDADAREELLDVDGARHQRRGGQLVEEVEGGLGDDGAGQEHRGRAHLPEPLDVVGRDHAADHDHDVVAAEVGERLLQRGQQRQVPGGQRADADDVHVRVDGLLGDLLGRGEQRPDVDVEAEVGEGGDDDLLAPVVPVLAHLGDQDPRPAALLGLERLGGGEHPADQPVGVVGRPRTCTRR